MVNPIVSDLLDARGSDLLSSAAVKQRAAEVLRPIGALRRLDEVAEWLAGWQRTDCPAVSKPGLLLAAADHGVESRGVSAYPQEVTTAMADAIRAGVATSTVLASSLDVALRLLDVGVGNPTSDLVAADAMDLGRFSSAFEAGRAAVADMDVDLLLIGEMGIGNTTAAAAVSHALFGGDADDWVGTGTGIDEETRRQKSLVVDQAVQRLGQLGDPIEVLRRVGGAEMAALAGATVEARVRSIPVLLDGYVTCAAVAPLEVAVPGALDHVLAAHVSPERGHERLLARLSKQPLLDLSMRLGEGSGALIAVPIIRAAALAVTDVATFDEWGLR